MGVEGPLTEVVHGGPEHGMPPWAEGTSLPAFTHIDGRNVALVDAGEYRALLALADGIARADGAEPAYGTIAPADAAEAREAVFPMRVQLGGVEVLVRPVSAPAVASDSRRRGSRRARRGRLSQLDRDTELAGFIMGRVEREEIGSVRLAAIERFGRARVPGRSAVYRYVQRQLADG